MASLSYDLLVIGAGSGGLACAKRAAKHGAEVCLIEQERVGGTCVLRGCVPKKIMVYASAFGRSGMALAEAYGLNIAGVGFDDTKLIAQRCRIVDHLEQSHRDTVKEHGITLFQGKALIRSAHEVQLTTANALQTITGKHLVIATGSYPRPLAIEGSQYAINSDGFFDLKNLPKKALIIGSGYIAAELAAILYELGCQTTLLVRQRLLSQFDDDLSEALTASYRRQGIEIYQGVAKKISPISTAPGAKSLYELQYQDLQQNDQHVTELDAVFVAIGRIPNTHQLFHDNLSVALDKHQAIKVNDCLETSVRGIYAIGDVTGVEPLTPVAIRAARILADRLFKDSFRRFRTEQIPHAVFSQPQVAVVGLSEKQAKEYYGNDVSIQKRSFSPLRYMVLDKEKRPKTLLKIIYQTSRKKILGFQMMGDDAAEIIQALAVSLQCGVHLGALANTYAVHPTVAEEWVLSFPPPNF